VVARTIVGLAIVLAVVSGLYWLVRTAAKAKSGQLEDRIEVVATTTPIRVYTAEEARAMDLQLAPAAQSP